MVLNMGLMVGCSTGSVTKDEGDALLKRAQALRQEWNKEDPQFEAFAKKGYGYVLFPEITKGACSSVVPMVGVSSTRKVNTSVTGT